VLNIERIDEKLDSKRKAFDWDAHIKPVMQGIFMR